jgi:hypothetical protein
MSNARYDASIVMTCHREGVLAHLSWLALRRCREFAEKSGYSIQFILSLDRADDETTRVVKSLPGLASSDSVVEVDYGDLGLSRNHAIGLADGEYVGICDGDDYLSANWIVRSLESARGAADRTIWHPELIVLFEGWHALSRQVAQDDPAFDRNAMLVMNPWNSCSFAHRTTYLGIPYLASRPGETGFGFEDWHWNCETLAQGFRHCIASETMHFVRRKDSGSLNLAHARNNALIHATKLFDRAD